MFLPISENVIYCGSAEIVSMRGNVAEVSLNEGRTVQLNQREAYRLNRWLEKLRQKTKLPRLADFKRPKAFGEWDGLGCA